MPQAAQAYLDDLASGVHNVNRPLSLARLSELARRIGAAGVNGTLGELFPQEGGGPPIVLDPRYYPEIDAVMVRPPPPKASGVR